MRTLLLLLAMALAASAAPPTGGITRHVWTGVGGSELANLRGLATFPNTPSLTTVLTTNFDCPRDWANDYGTRVFGWVHAPVTGDYRFYIHSDDQSELWLGTDESPDTKRKIAGVPDWANAGDWVKFPDQTSVVIPLEGGKYYYIEALQKEGGGGDNLGVGWTYPGQASIAYIPATRLSTWQNVAPILNPDEASVYRGSSAIIPVLRNDVEPNGKSDFNLASLTVLTQPNQGTATVHPNGGILYTSDEETSGITSFTYRIADQAGLTSTATVTVIIQENGRLHFANSRMPASPPPQQLTAINAFPSIGFSEPLDLATPPGETNRLFVVEKGGDIEVIPNLAAPAAQTFLNLDAIVNARTAQLESFMTNGESGLLGLAFHPDYATNRRFFVYYTLRINNLPHQRLSEFACSAGNPNLADPASEKVFLQLRDDYDNHNGGCVKFGPDGYLYLSLGDEGDQNDAGDNSQKITKDFWSGMIRIDVNVDPANYGANPNLPPNPHVGIVLDTASGNPRYKVPTDNPWIGATTFNGVPLVGTVRTEFYAVGLRNPWRYSFDTNGDLWLADVGGGSWEEVNKIIKGGNYEWAYREGITGQGPRWNQRPAGWTGANPPLLAYGHGSGTLQGNSITGGLVYRGTRLPDLTGKYIFADYSSGNIWSLDPAIGASSFTRLTGEGGIVGFGTDPSNGDLLLADINGQVRRLVSQAVDTGFPATLTDTGLFDDVATLTPTAGLVAYDVNLPFWSDHAKKRRWFGIPAYDALLGFHREGTWTTPAGTVWVKHFDIETTRGNPATAKRLETRVLVRNEEGAYGVSYRWNAAGTEATLANEAGEEFNLSILVNGTPTNQLWRIPSRSECMTCHTPQAGHSLSFNTRQLNLPGAIGPDSGNFIQLLEDTEYLTGLADSPATLPKHVATNDAAYSLEARARAWLDVNCAYCHKPGGTAPANFDARATVPLFDTNLVNVPPTGGTQHPDDRLIVPAAEERSVIIHRAANRNGYSRMPPLGSNVTDPAGVQLLIDWVESIDPDRQSFTAWTTGHLGSLPPADQLPTADPDGDGRDNRSEFLAYTDPTNPDSAPAPTAVSITGALLSITFPDLPGRGMILQSSANLADWSDWPVPGNDGLERSGPWQIQIPVEPGKGFYRARLEER
jgi:uncharacterized repeat protein (TIGR03806 family)